MDKSAKEAELCGGCGRRTFNEHTVPGIYDGELLLRRSAAASDRMDLFVFANADTSQARLAATLDNLGKGASGAAVQSLNLMAGLDETAGLRG